MYNEPLNTPNNFLFCVRVCVCPCVQIVRCPSLPCEISSPDECLWTDLMIDKQVYGLQANHFACIKRADDSCSWYRGVSSLKKEFLDGGDP